MNKTTSPYAIVKQSSIHHRGVFAKKDIPKNSKIIEYVGKKITKAQADKIAQPQIEKAQNNKTHGAVFLFSLNKRYDIDGNVSYNTARLINHSCDPNCEADIIKGHIWIIATEDIKKGEELAYNYGYDLDDYKSHKCFCNTKRCVGYIADEEFWPKLKKFKKKSRA